MDRIILQEEEEETKVRIKEGNHHIVVVEDVVEAVAINKKENESIISMIGKRKLQTRNRRLRTISTIVLATSTPAYLKAFLKASVLNLFSSLCSGTIRTRKGF